MSRFSRKSPGPEQSKTESEKEKQPQAPNLLTVLSKMFGPEVMLQAASQQINQLQLVVMELHETLHSAADIMNDIMEDATIDNDLKARISFWYGVHGGFLEQELATGKFNTPENPDSSI